MLPNIFRASDTSMQEIEKHRYNSECMHVGVERLTDVDKGAHRGCARLFQGGVQKLHMGCLLTG